MSLINISCNGPRTTVGKYWLRKPRTIAIPVYFLGLDFDYGIYKHCSLVSYASNFLSIGYDFTRWGIDGGRNRLFPQDPLVRGDRLQ